MRARSMSNSACWMVLGLALTSGCSGSADGKLAVSGQVKLKGQALDQGSIEFFDRETGQAVAGAMIKDGSFSIPAEGGVRPGTYRVVISSGEAGTRDEDGPPGMAGPVARERIPPQYNRDSDKQPVLQEINEGNRTQINFDIP